MHKPRLKPLLGTLILILLATAAVIAFPDKTYVVICFDVEDYTTPVSEGIDDIPKWLAETMTEVGVTGTFFVIGEKARSLEKRGRHDVISAMAQHDIGSHTDRGSIHPTVTEILEKAGWSQGLERMLAQESAGFRDLERIFQKPVTSLARHGGSYGPQLVGALAKLKAGYVYSPVRLPGHNAVWFCNTLNFCGSYGGFDDTYYRNELFEPRFQKLKERFTEDIAGLDVLAFFAGHPCKIRTEQFWDFNYYKGANPGPDEWKTPRLRPLESMVTARRNFRRLLQFLKDREDIVITTFADLMQRFSHQPADIHQMDLKRIARNILDTGEIVVDGDYSPTEVFAALTESLQEYAGSGRLPKSVVRRSPLGPMQMPPEQPEIIRISTDQALRAAGKAFNFLRNRNALPALIQVNGRDIGTGSLLALFCEMFLKVFEDTRPDHFLIIPFEGYPRAHAGAIIRSVEGCKSWPVHREDLDMSRLVEMTKMQLWTLKPAKE